MIFRVHCFNRYVGVDTRQVYSTDTGDRGIDKFGL